LFVFKSRDGKLNLLYVILKKLQALKEREPYIDRKRERKKEEDKNRINGERRLININDRTEGKKRNIGLNME
jgi:hypothetical protein